MLRILVFDEPFSVKLRLEGELTDQTTPQLTQRWAEVRGGLRNRRAILDLGDLVEVDQAGRKTLMWLTDSGVRVSYAHPKLRPVMEELARLRPGSPSFFGRILQRLGANRGQRRSASFLSRVYQLFCAVLPARLRACGDGPN